MNKKKLFFVSTLITAKTFVLLGMDNSDKTVAFTSINPNRLSPASSSSASSTSFLNTILATPTAPIQAPSTSLTLTTNSSSSSSSLSLTNSRGLVEKEEETKKRALEILKTIPAKITKDNIEQSIKIFFQFSKLMNHLLTTNDNLDMEILNLFLTVTKRIYSSYDSKYIKLNLDNLKYFKETFDNFQKKISINLLNNLQNISEEITKENIEKNIEIFCLSYDLYVIYVKNFSNGEVELEDAILNKIEKFLLKLDELSPEQLKYFIEIYNDIAKLNIHKMPSGFKSAFHYGTIIVVERELKINPNDLNPSLAQLKSMAKFMERDEIFDVIEKHWELGKFFLKRGKQDLAYIYFKKAYVFLNLTRDYIDLLFNLDRASILNDFGEFLISQNKYEEVLKIFEDHVSFPLKTLKLRLILSLFKKYFKDKEEEIFRKFINEDCYENLLEEIVSLMISIEKRQSDKTDKILSSITSSIIELRFDKKILECLNRILICFNKKMSIY